MLQKGLGRSAEQNRGLGGDIRLKSGPYLVLFVLLHAGRPDIKVKNHAVLTEGFRV